MGLTVNRQLTKKLTDNRQKRNIFTVSDQGQVICDVIARAWGKKF